MFRLPARPAVKGAGTDRQRSAGYRRRGGPRFGASAGGKVWDRGAGRSSTRGPGRPSTRVDGWSAMELGGAGGRHFAVQFAICAPRQRPGGSEDVQSRIRRRGIQATSVPKDVKAVVDPDLPEPDLSGLGNGGSWWGSRMGT